MSIYNFKLRQKLEFLGVPYKYQIIISIMSKKVVLKIGGSILKNKKSVEQILEILKIYPENPVLVVSAFYGITD